MEVDFNVAELAPALKGDFFKHCLVLLDQAAIDISCCSGSPCQRPGTIGIESCGMESIDRANLKTLKLFCSAFIGLGAADDRFF
jgi:hypothetical protein